MTDFSKYVGIPYLCDGRDEKGLDCWGLVKLIYEKELGITLPDFSGIHTNDTKDILYKVSNIIVREAQKWRQIDKPEVFDVVLMRRGLLNCHIGLYINNNDMIHAVEGLNTVCESIKDIRWSKRIVGFFRYEK